MACKLNKFAARFDSGHEEPTANGGASYLAVLFVSILLFRQFVLCGLHIRTYTLVDLP